MAIQLIGGKGEKKSRLKESETSAKTIHKPSMKVDVYEFVYKLFIFTVFFF